MRTRDLQDLLEYFGREQACYTSLLDLSRLQRPLIEQGDMDQLLAVLGQKQQILARVARIEENLQPYKQQWNLVREALSADDRNVVDSALATVEELLAELIEIERESEQLLMGGIEDIRRECADTSRAQGVHNAYARPTIGSAHVLLDSTEA